MVSLPDLWAVVHTEALGRSVAISLAVSLSATALATLLGTPLGAALAICRVPGRRIIVIAVNALLGLPPVVVGLALYLLSLGRARSGCVGGNIAGYTRTTAIVLETSEGHLSRALGLGMAIAGRSHGTTLSSSGRDPIRPISRAATRRQPPSKAIAAARAPFVSRGDKSGTDALEHRLWRVAKIDPAQIGGGSWYREIGGGMGAALNTAAAIGAYTLSDRGTWLSFGNKRDLIVLVEGDTRLLNRYDVILVDPVKHPQAKQEPARTLVDWLASPRGQAAIGAYEINGEQLFHPSAAAPK